MMALLTVKSRSPKGPPKRRTGLNRLFEPYQVALYPDMPATGQGRSTLSSGLTVGTVVNEPVSGRVQDQPFLFPHFH